MRGLLPARLFGRPRPAPFEIIRLSAPELEPLADQLLPVYHAAFAAPPYNRTAAQTRVFAGTLALHTWRRDFRCCIAREPASGRIVGFTYGYTGEAGQWWHEIVAGAIGGKTAARFLDGGFEFVELAMLPELQGWGLGGQLHDALLDGVANSTAVLSTIQRETAALQLYRKRGWKVLLQDLTFPRVPEPYIVMGIDLPLMAKEPQRG